MSFLSTLARFMSAVVQDDADAAAATQQFRNSVATGFQSTATLLTTILQEIKAVSDALTQLQATANDLKDKVDAAETRDQARAQVLTNLQATVAASAAQVADLQQQLAAMPHVDTAAQEAALASISSTLTAAASEVDNFAKDPTPAAAATAGTGATATGDASTGATDASGAASTTAPATTGATDATAGADPAGGPTGAALTP